MLFLSCESSFNWILWTQLSFLKIQVYFALYQISPSYLVWVSLNTLQPKPNAAQEEQTCKPPFQRKTGLWCSCPTAGLTSFLALRTTRLTRSFSYNGGPHEKLETSVHSSRQASLISCLLCSNWTPGTVWKSKELDCSKGWDSNGGFKLVSVFPLHRRYISQQTFGWLAPFLFLSYVLQHLGTKEVW